MLKKPKRNDYREFSLDKNNLEEIKACYENDTRLFYFAKNIS